MNKYAGKGYDLHTHSRLSDGTDSPAEIAQTVFDAGLLGFALTDHDIVTGWDEARATAQKLGIGFIPGTEITTLLNGRTRHLLAYGFNPDSELMIKIAYVAKSRVSRVQEMVSLLQADYEISLDDVCQGAEAIGRPHIADALVKAGYAADRGQVFREIIHKDSPYYVQSFGLDIFDAVRLVADAGGVSVLAHPIAERETHAVTDAEIADLADAGLFGLEIWHPENRASDIDRLLRCAQTHGLQITGASDYHGTGKPNRLGEYTTPESVVAEIMERCAV